MTDYFEAAPSAASMIEGLRDFGYTLQTAIADIVDNSITYGASQIDIRMKLIDGVATFAIADNGDGMSEAELQIAMQPGSKSPLDKRPINDLGRFGLGLKTASFSQARQLIVVARKDSETVAYEWDLDYVQQVNKWLIRKVPVVSDLQFIELLDQSHGTLVIWQKVDRLGHGPGEPVLQDTFDRAIKTIHEHLGVVFHRFIDGTSFSKRKIRISLNNLEIQSKNPFNAASLKTTSDAPDTITYGKAGHSVKVQAFTLPHPRSVNENEWRKYEGEKGYDGSQGFYLYRSDRLIVAGDWFRIIPKSPSTKLLRVSLDISNQCDADWQINVLKAHAQPPISIRRELSKRLENWTTAARRPYVGRGRPLPAAQKFVFWNRQVEEREIRYKIDLDNPAIQSLKSKLNNDLQVEFENVLEYISSSVPYDSIFVDLSDNHGHVSYSNASTEQLLGLARIITENIRSQSPDVALEQIRETLRVLPIFANHEEIIDSFEGN